MDLLTDRKGFIARVASAPLVYTIKAFQLQIWALDDEAQLAIRVLRIIVGKLKRHRSYGFMLRRRGKVHPKASYRNMPRH